MKTKISFLTLIFSLSSIMILISSCAKDDSVTLTDHDQVPTTTWQAGQNLDNSFTNGEAPEQILASRSTNPGVAVEAFVCADGGATLVVYNPEDPDYNFFNNPRQYEIYWLRGGELAGTRSRLNCVCPGKYSVTVIDKVAQIGIGRTIYLSQTSCDLDDLPDSGGSSDGT